MPQSSRQHFKRNGNHKSNICGEAPSMIKFSADENLQSCVSNAEQCPVGKSKKDVALGAPIDYL